MTQKLTALFQVIVEEAAVNPGFAQKLDRALGGGLAGAAPAPAEAPVETVEGVAEPLVSASTDEAQEAESEATAAPIFDPLAVHLEAALMNGMEPEVRLYLSRLTPAQLQDVVLAQRLPAAQTVVQKITDAPDLAAAVEAVLDSAIGKVRGRVSAAS